MRSFKIKYKLFIAFITISIFSLFFIFISIWLYKQRDKVSEELNILEDIQISSLEQYKLQQEFFLHESINLDFFRTGESSILKKHRLLANNINSNLRSLINHSEALQLFEKDFLNNLVIEQNNYEHIFEDVVKEIKVKGFKDFGIEGEMRKYAHALMDVSGIDQTKVLMLRRHEKDFIIRKELVYIDKFSQIIYVLKKEVKASNKLTFTQKIMLDSIINGYSSAFTKFVSSSLQLIGSGNKNGLIFKLSDKHNLIINSILINKLRAKKLSGDVFNKLMITSIVSIVIIFILAFLFSFRLAFEVSKPIEILNNHINKYVESKFTNIPLIDVAKTNDEISILSNNFFKMSEEITNHIKFFELKVQERTSEINKQNSEISRQKLKIHNQYKELFVKNISLEKQQNLILEKNRNITDSILYAERIQKSMMPSKALLRSIVPNGFIFFQPRDIVSGDFYFAIEKKDKVYFGIADCTGHGVPGAFLSIIGNHALNRAINEFELDNPAEILNKVNELVEKSVSNHDDTIILDGMDIALCSFDRVKNILEYAGANIPLWIITEEEDQLYNINSEPYIKEIEVKFILKEIKPDKQPIGYFHYRHSFTNNEIQLNSKDRIYISSDGYADQFGGSNNKKFKNNQLRNLLLSIQHKSMDEQKLEIKEAHKVWKGSNEQVDDICMLGIQI